MTVFREDVVEIMPRLRGYARSLCGGDPVLADDLVQDTLVRALRSQNQFQPGTNFDAWMFTILRNVFFTTVRRQQVYVDLELFVSGSLLKTEGDQSNRLELQALQHAFSKLSAAQREILVLTAIDGLDYETIAERLGCRVGTVKSRVNRARERLHAILFEDQRIDGDPAAPPPRTKNRRTPAAADRDESPTSEPSGHF
jgi:RNA polymerase sigma-70 factor (ECF subfamily)